MAWMSNDILLFNMYAVYAITYSRPKPYVGLFNRCW